MANVFIMTRHAISNYGSLLQSIATQEMIMRLGFEPKIINYIREDEDYHNIVKVLLVKNRKWNKNPVTRTVYKIILSPEYLLMGKKFQQMRKKYLTMTDSVRDDVELAKLEDEGDIFLTGSDQVWGPIGADEYDPNYFLQFLSDNAKKVSYAASFGKTNLTNEIKALYAKMLSAYDVITVREDSAIQVLNEIGISNVPQVLDPTLLLDRNDWAKYITKKYMKRYVLIYQLHANKEMDKYAVAFASKVGLPLIRVTPAFHQIFRSGKTILLPDLGDFLGFIKNAEYMITDSFHGTAFAINFGTQFLNVLSGAKSDQGQSNIDITKTRNLSILHLTGLEDRVLSRYDDFSLIDKKIDFYKVDQILAVERKKSVEIMKKLIEVNR